MNKKIDYKNYIYFCYRCNVPLIEKKCLLCMNDGEKIILSYPSDIRISMEYETNLINQLLIKYFLVNPLKNKLLLLNKIPGDDLVLQIFSDGFKFGTLEYDLKKLKYTIKLSINGSKLFFMNPNLEICNKKIIILNKILPHSNDKKLPLSFIDYFPENISINDPVLIKYKNSIGYGISLISSDFLKLKVEKNKKEVNFEDIYVIKVKKISSENKPNISDKNIDIDLIINANKKYLQNIGKTAINLIKGFCCLKTNNKKIIYSSFSGGKDSTVCLDLTKKALGNKFSAVFLNTGIDYSETVNFVRRHCEKNKVNLIELKGENIFWDKLITLQHPTKDNRWCCEVCKLNLMNKLNNNLNEKYITIDGKRKYESFNRSKIKNIGINPKVSNQINIYPISNWRALEVWLYIYWRKLEYNELYNKGFERIGCWMCPSALQSEYNVMCTLHPEYKKKWDNYLESWRKKEKLDKKYIDYGFWRWKKLPPKMNELARELNINILKKDNE